jgi:hypothetical protein
MFAVKRVDFAAQNEGRFSDTKLKPPVDWMAALRELMKGYRHSGAIRSVDALLYKLCDEDGEAMMMLKHVLEWQPFSKRDDGAVWRSADEWKPYTGLSRSQVYNETRRARLRKAGLKVWVERAMGENTLHFLVDAAKFTANICALLGLNYNHALLKLWDIVPIEVRQPILFPQVGIPNGEARVSNGEARVSNDEIPLTESTTKDTTDKTTSVLLNSVSLSVDEKAKYGVLPADVVQPIFDVWAAKKKSGALRKNSLAYLRGMLKTALKGHLEQAQVSATPQTPPLNPLPIAEAEKVVAADLPPAWWSSAMLALELQMGRMNDWVFLARMAYGNCSENLVTILVPNSSLWMVQRFQRNIERAITDVRSQTTKVRFESREQANG